MPPDAPSEPRPPWLDHPIKFVPLSVIRANQAAADRMAELAAAAGRTTQDDPVPPTENGDVRRIEGRLVFRRERSCPITRAPFWALFECDVPPVYGPWETRVVGNKIHRDREVISQAQPGQKWEESPSQIWRGMTATKPLRPWEPWPHPKDGLVGEALRFSEQYPALGALLLTVLDVEIPAAPEGIFSVGSVAITPTPGLFKIDPRVYLERHLRGDLGDNGPLEGELAELEEFAPQLFGQGIESRAALKTGHGLIRSVYPIEGHRGEHLKVATLLTPNRAPETAIWTSRDR